MSSTIKIKAPAMPEPTRQEEQAPFEAWADNYSPSGDCESLHRQWKESSWRESWLQERDAYYRERDAQWQEMVGPVVEAARKLMTMRVGELPLTGYLSDNDISRAALGELNLALSAITEE
jgi:hypothetical protein